jgi:predicted nucleotide-binding protein (sugar kinase/HSP70/actin superfamily)
MSMNVDTSSTASIEAELLKFETEERKRLGLDDNVIKQHWYDPVPGGFTKDQREHTTLLVSGLTMAQDLFVQSALRGLGYKVQHLDCPDNSALRYGKEFGNRGQCNPTYFTVGNLVKHLSDMRDAGMPTKDVVNNYIFLTAGACGPCRFGTYVTEYRKALRDSGFDGFRVMLFQQQGGLKQATGDEVGLDMGAPFFLALLKSLLTGDILNALGYRIRPYELEKGSTDAALERCKKIISSALEESRSIWLAMLRVRLEMSKIKVDRTIPKPKVGIIGEFWAMTTEGDGNYKLQRFLESEGAEVDVQLVTAWLLYNIWEVRHDTKDRMTLREDDAGKKGLQGMDAWKRLLMLFGAEVAVRSVFQTFANLMGLHGYVLPDMEQVANVSHKYYDNDLRGGEGHMEVGKLILNILHSKVNMTLSVKPFGCMPSSGVSDGVQSYITEKFPGGIFCAIETSGDGAVNVQSRVQMMLFKAKQSAIRESEQALQKHGMSLDEAKSILGKVPFVGHSLFKPGHVHGSTAADMIELAAALKNPLKAIKNKLTASKEHKKVVEKVAPASSVKPEAPAVELKSRESLRILA